MKNQVIQDCLSCLDSGYTVIYEDGFPFYDRSILALEDYLYQNLLMDQNYIENYNDIKDKKIEDLSLKETYTYITYIFRNESFVNGHIDQFIKNGILKELLERI